MDTPSGKCDRPTSGIVNKCAYRRAAFNAEMEFEDEISNLYMKKTRLNSDGNGIDIFF